MPSDVVFDETITIRFDGLEADRHEIELPALAESLAGLSRIISASGHFALTQKVTLNKSKDIRLVARAPEAKCYVIDLVIQHAKQFPMLADYSTQVVAGLTVSVVTYIFASAANKREEMKQLRGALDTAIKQLGTRDQATVDRLLETVDKMAEALKPSSHPPSEQSPRSASRLERSRSLQAPPIRHRRS